MEVNSDLKPRKKIYCDVCNTFISSELLLVMHNNGKKHQRLVKVREERKASTERSIYVRGFENRTTLESDLHEYFAQFGKVSNVFVDKEKAKYAIVEFESPSEVQAILSSKQLPMFFGKHLIIKKRIFKEPVQKSPKQSSKMKKEKVSLGQQKIGSFLEERILDKIRCSLTLNEQILEVVSSTSLTDDDLKLRSLIVEYLQEIFVEIFPACVVTAFGSTATGLGLRGADMDLCLLVDHEALNVVLDQDDSLPSSSDLTQHVLEFIVNILRKFAAGIQNVVSVSTTKCPVVKFIHRDSGLSCDLSINNRLAIRNTELIKSYLTLDDRIRLLAITLKNWGAAKRLIESGGRQISSYCLVLMLLHFLQRTCPPVIPVLQQARDSEEMSMKDSKDIEKMIIDGWDCSFVSTTAETSQNKDSLGTLLEDWFHYYGTTFDYVNEVIAIQRDINERVVKPGIEEGISQVSVKSAMFKPSVLCVQDPLELSHNLTQNVSEETLEIFIQSCRKAYTLLSNQSEQTKDICATSAFVELFTIPVETKQKSRKSSYVFTIPYVKSTTFSDTPLHQTAKFITDLLNRQLQMTCEFQLGTDESTPTENAIPKHEISTESETHDDSMCVDEDTAIDNKDFVLTSRKRSHEEQHFKDLPAKRMKINSQSESTSLTYLCRAKQVTWQNRRRLRRLQTANHESCRRDSAETEDADSHSDESSHTILQNVPDQLSASTSCMEVSHNTVGVSVLEFKLTISEQNNQGTSLSANPQCNVVLTHLEGLLQHFANFFAFFKKFVVQNITECD